MNKSERIRQGYRDRLILPEFCKEEIDFFTESGLKIATNYIRVVIGDRGPYIEFTDDMIEESNIYLPQDKLWRVKNALCYYIEYRSNDEQNIMIYKQKKTVKYADYKIGLWYISPFLLITGKYSMLVKKL